MELKSGYKQTEAGVIPEDWNVCNLEDAVEFLDGQRKPIKSSDRARIQGAYPYYGASGIVDYVNGYIFDEELILLGEDGENILSRNLPLAFRVFGKIWVNNHAHVMRPRKTFSIGYLTEFLESRDYSLLNSGTAQPKLNKQTCLKIKIAQPTKAEQTAIANALSDADALIQSLTRLIAKKRQIKQGAMQTLLNPYENGRLKAGWVMKKLGELCNPSSVRINPRIERKIYKCIELEHIDQGSGRLLGHVSSNNQLSQKTLFKKGDVLFGKLRPYLKKYLFAEFDGVCSTEIWVLKSENSVSSLWLYYLVQSDQIVEAANQSTGTKMPRAEWRVVKNTEVNFPSSLNEQTRIATILSGMDAEIAALEAKLAKYQQIKQGMMQNLLTGKIRLI